MLRRGLTRLPSPSLVAARSHATAAPAAAARGEQSSMWKAAKDPNKLMHLVLSGISLALALRLVRTGHKYEEEANDLQTQLCAAEQRTARALACAPGLAVAAGLPAGAAESFGAALRAELSRPAEDAAAAESAPDSSARRPVARPNAVF